jgi:PKD repeat protein
MKIDLKNKYQIALILIVSVVCFMSAMVVLSPYTKAPGGQDADKDTVKDTADNCPAVPNSDQSDVDDDGTGDVCDTCTDTDDDGYGNPGYPQNSCPDDNCPDTPNADQADIDSDTIGDMCDECPDDPLNDVDNDDICGGVDNCPDAYNPGQIDSDADGTGDACELPPTADFTVRPVEPIHGEIIQFSDVTTPGGGPLSVWHWSFGDNTTSPERHPTHIYTNIGMYTVQLTVTDINGNTDIKIKDVRVIDNDPPDKPTIIGPRFGKTRVNYTFGITTTDPDGDQISYEIDWADHTSIVTLGPYNSGIEITTTHSWGTAGRYIIWVKARESHSAESDSTALLVRIVDVYLLNPSFIRFFEQNHQILFFRILNP